MFLICWMRRNPSCMMWPRVISKNLHTAQNLVILAKKKIEEIANKDGLSGVATGFEKLDLLTSGWQPSDLIIIAARPGMGKTALTLSMARNMAVTQQTPVAFSLSKCPPYS